MTMPEKPNSRLQRYRLTERARLLIDAVRQDGARRIE